MIKLNLGCGAHRLNGFVNLDKKRGWCFEDGLPQYEDNSVDAITISHALMMVDENDYLRFFKEARRVLKPCGVIRITEDDTTNPKSDTYPDGWKDAVSLTGPDKIKTYLLLSDFIAYQVTSEETFFTDKSLIQTFHDDGNPDRVFHIEGIKPAVDVNINPVEWTQAGLNREFNRKDRRHMNKEIMKHITPEDEILDIGAGGGTQIKLLREAGVENVIHVLDHSRRALDFLMKKPELNISGFMWGDIREGLYVKDDSYDIVMSLDVVEHLNYPREFIAEMLRIARKKVIISCPYMDNFKGEEHVLWFNENALRALSPNPSKIYYIPEKKPFYLTVYDKI